MRMQAKPLQAPCYASYGSYARQALTYHKCFRKNAFPEPCFKYFSNEMALASDSKQADQCIDHG